MNKRLTFWSATGFVVIYFVAVFASEFIGVIHPLCWLLAPALGALLGALPYRWLALRWDKFGLGTVLAAVFALLMLAMGEFDLWQVVIVMGCGLLSDAVRLLAKCDWAAYPVLALGNMAPIIYMWTRKAWYLDGAANEMGQAYADAMAPLQTPVWLIIAVVAIVAAAECGLWIAKKIIK